MSEGLPSMDQEPGDVGMFADLGEETDREAAELNRKEAAALRVRAENESDASIKAELLHEAATLERRADELWRDSQAA